MDGGRQPETEVSAALREHLTRLAAEGRCVWAPEVRLLAWTHASRTKADTLRIDFVASFDGGPLVGLEVKRRPEAPVELGRALFQCSQYAAAVVAPALAGTVPQAWLQRPLKAVFLRIPQAGLSPSLTDHAKAAVRLFGPANVGFVTFTRWNGMRLDIGGDRWWCERYGHRANAADRTSRVGNGNFRPEDGE